MLNLGIGIVDQLVRSLACHVKGCGFKSRLSRGKSLLHFLSIFTIEFSDL